MCLYGAFVIVFGGTGYPFGQDVSNDLFILDLKRKHWKRHQLLDQQPEQVYGAVTFRICFLLIIMKYVFYYLEYDYKERLFIYFMWHKSMAL